MPPFSRVHTFCAFRDVAANRKVSFCADCDNVEIEDLRKGYWKANKKKISDNHAFFRIIELQFGKQLHTLLGIFNLEKVAYIAYIVFNYL